MLMHTIAAAEMMHYCIFYSARTEGRGVARENRVREIQNETHTHLFSVPEMALQVKIFLLT
jgi:hypothetical protein